MNLYPLEYNVIIKPDKVEEVSAGGIILSTGITDRQKFEVQEGEIVALSPHAFSYAEWPEDARVPQVGDRVVFARHAGALYGKAPDEVRVVKDKDVIAVIAEEPALSAAA